MKRRFEYDSRQNLAQGWSNPIGLHASNLVILVWQRGRRRGSENIQIFVTSFMNDPIINASITEIKLFYFISEYKAPALTPMDTKLIDQEMWEFHTQIALN